MSWKREYKKHYFKHNQEMLINALVTERGLPRKAAKKIARETIKRALWEKRGSLKENN